MLGITPATLISRVIILVIAFTLHEYAHARLADAFGDPTPREAGQLTLNPLVHLDPVGTLLLILLGFGWAKPTPINPEILRRRSPAAVMLVSVAGPLTNLILAALVGLVFRLGLVRYTGATGNILPTLSEFLVEFVYINVALFLFNILPLAPLDGEKVLEYLLPSQWQGAIESVRRFGPLLLLFLVFVGPLFGFDLFGTIIQRPLNAITSFFIGV